MNSHVHYMTLFDFRIIRFKVRDNDLYTENCGFWSIT
jgi:hypothetical protein